MRPVFGFLLGLGLFLLPSLSPAQDSIPTARAVPDSAAPTPASANAPVSSGAPRRSQRAGFLFLPNGWGSTPEIARRDLDRVMAVFEDRPGFHRYSYVKIVQVGKNSYEADGMCTWDAPDVMLAVDPRKRNR